VTQRGGSYFFESNLLRDWWKARFEFAYIPASKRETFVQESGRRTRYGFTAD